MASASLRRTACSREKLSRAAARSVSLYFSTLARWITMLCVKSAMELCRDFSSSTA